MSLIRRRHRNMPSLNTASLPDLIFVVLFFFMIVTHMRTETLKVEYTVPEGTELTHPVKKSTVVHIHIGKPIGHKDNSSSAVHNRCRNALDGSCQLAEAGQQDGKNSRTADNPGTKYLRHGQHADILAISSVRHGAEKAGQDMVRPLHVPFPVTGAERYLRM